MNIQNPDLKHTPARCCRTARTNSAVVRRLLPAALAALAIAAGTPRVPACGIELGAGSTMSLYGNFTVDCVGVATGARLFIMAGTLTLTGCGGQDTSAVDGRVILNGPTSVLRIASNDHTLTGQGYVQGRHNFARIEIGSARTVNSGITIEGMLQICPAPGASNTTFVNASGGRVRANTAGTLDVAPDVVLGAGDWQVSASGSAVLQFTTGSHCLGGDFEVDAGRLNILADVCTSGVLNFQAGEIDVAAESKFSAGGSRPCEYRL
jgi:hypothetical protein